MILCDRDLSVLLEGGLIKSPLPLVVNPASVDICTGLRVFREILAGNGFIPHELNENGLVAQPGEFLLVETLETFNVPNGYALELRLKSSSARRGWNHSLAFWVDPGWQGVLTMEVSNVLRHGVLLLRPRERFAQVIVHKLSGLSARPYDGRYKGATSVERAKP